MFRRNGNDAEILAPKRPIVSGSSTRAGKPHIKVSGHSQHVSLSPGPHYRAQATLSRASGQVIARFRPNHNTSWPNHNHVVIASCPAHSPG